MVAEQLLACVLLILEKYVSSNKTVTCEYSSSDTAEAETVYENSKGKGACALLMVLRGKVALLGATSCI